MKPTKVKAWPDLTGYIPALPVLADARRQAKTEKPLVEVDFGNVRSVSAVGLTVFIFQLLRFLGQYRFAIIRKECSEKIKDQISQLGGFEILAALFGSLQPELLSEEESDLPNESCPLGNKSLPIYHLKFGEGEQRSKAVTTFLHKISDDFIEIFKDVCFEANGLLMLLNEIAKNSADHTKEDALFALDVFHVDNKTSRISFAFGDFGVGIKRHIEEHLPPEEIKRKPHFSLYEAYRLALKQGYTSNSAPNRNKGQGMTIIMDVASSLGMHLSVFDAWSRGVLSQFPNAGRQSHDSVRRIFHNVGHDVGFFYYGEIFVNRRPN